tara:strand:+ start:343 stop:570 length:228 start_codon:yes stop_codon:yes gene_type:complete
MNILKEAIKRVEKEVNKLSIQEIIKIDMYKFKNELMDYYIKEIQKEVKKEKMIKKIFDITPKKDLVNFLEINKIN